MARRALSGRAKKRKTILLRDFIEYPEEEVKQRAVLFLEMIQKTSTVRHFARRPVDNEVIETCISRCILCREFYQKGRTKSDAFSK